MKAAKFLSGVLIWVSVVLFLLPTDHYYIDLLQSFAFHALLGYLVCAVFFGLVRWRIVAASAIAVSFLLAVHLLPHISNHGGDSYQINGRTFKVAHFNVLASNKIYDKSIRQATETQADLLSFQEVNMDWINQLIDKLEADYPYYAFVDGEAHGIAVFSKYPLDNIRSFHWTGEPTLTGDMYVDNQKIHFLTTHTLSPRSPERSQNRNKHLVQIANYVKSITGPVLAIGDFNTVPWSQAMLHVKKHTGLYDSRKSITPTYPASYSLGIPIDYILHSDELSCLKFDSVEASGSDHKGVIGEYALSNDAYFPKKLFN